MHNTKKYHTPAVLIILDGWGVREEKEYNAIAEADTPCFDALWRDCPHSLLEASGLAVGLPKGQMGNSEIGHTVIGAGTPMDTDLVRISKAVAEDDFKNNPAFQTLFAHVLKHDSVLHVQGLLSSGGVHSHQEHLYAFLRTAKEAGITKLAIHAFLDGRDTPPQSGVGFLEELEAILKEVGIGHIATMSGRFFAMDRDSNWERVARTTNAMFDGNAEATHPHTKTPSEVLRALYAQEKVDEHIEPLVFLDERGQAVPLAENDGLFFFNFRADRARAISEKIVEHAQARNICFVTLTEYDPTLKSHVAFPPLRPTITLADVIADAGLTQVHVAETEKYPHVTYYLNGGKEEVHTGETFVLLESRKDVQTHDQAPEMRAEDIAKKACEALENGADVLVMNFANADMVGHTAKVDAVHKAVSCVDSALQKVVSAVRQKGGFALIIADHGNAEESWDTKANAPHTAHTINPVPCILVGREGVLQNGTLADVAPTFLTLMGLEVPEEMKGRVMWGK